MDQNTLFLLVKIIGVSSWLALLFTLERWRPRALDTLRQSPPPDEGVFGWRRLLRNGLLWVGNMAISPLIILPITALAAAYSPIVRPEFLTGWGGVVIDILILDLAIYWWHRLNHEIPFLWRFHEVHHLDERLDTTSAVRFHFGEVIMSAFARAIPILALGIPLTTVVLFELLVLVSAIFQHSNISLPTKVERALSKVLITPSIHWVHHHAVRADTDSNYGTILSIWDPLFGSRSKTERTPEMPIGVQGLKDVPLTQLLWRPFRR
ncbi:MAG: sterol desaturase family protein [Pseudomonadota bacterium]